MKKTVLAIDDSLTIRELINFVLTSSGYEVRLAEDGIEGLEAMAEWRPDAIVTDINMPRFDGLGFIERARAIPNAAPRPSSCSPPRPTRRRRTARAPPAPPAGS